MRLAISLALGGRAGGGHDGMRADFIQGRFHSQPAGGAFSGFANGQSMFAWSSSVKWTRNGAGVWAATGANTPALEWDASGNALGVRIEAGARTNTCLWSDDLTNAAWVATNATTAKTATGADGVANSATTITATAANATVLQSFTSASAQRNFAAFVKRRAGTGAIQMTVDGGTTWAAVTVTNAWTQVQINQSAVTNPVIGFRIVTSGDAIDVMWCQLENGAAFASSPIPTTTASVTRNADNVSRAWGPEYNASEGAMVIAFRPLTATANMGVTSFGDGTGSGNMICFRQESASLLYVGYSASALQAYFFMGNGAMSAGVRKKAALAYKVNDFAGIVTGGALGTDTLGSVPAGVTTHRIGTEGNATNFPFFGHIESIDYYPTRLTNQQLTDAAA